MQIISELKYAMGLPSMQENGQRMKSREQESTEIDLEKRVRVFSDPYDSVIGSHAILVITEWDEFKDYDYSRMFMDMKKPASVFDGRIMLDLKKLSSIGFDTFSIGKPCNNINHGNGNSFATKFF